MSTEQKSPWSQLGKLASEQYAKAKITLDKKNGVLSKTAAKLGPKKQAAVEAKATAKSVLVSKAKVKPLPPTVIAKPTAGKVSFVAMVTQVPAPEEPCGAVAKVTASAIQKKPTTLAIKKTAVKVCVRLTNALNTSASNISKTVQGILTMATGKKLYVIYRMVLSSMTLNDRPRARHDLMLNISEIIQDRHVVTTDQ